MNLLKLLKSYWWILLLLLIGGFIISQMQDVCWGFDGKKCDSHKSYSCSGPGCHTN